ncbi:hypothetical protein KRP22_006895 [Phytophthora ramorum]|nr:hypothetical protein KRP22_1973 [Phytophthora ramorum]
MYQSGSSLLQIDIQRSRKGQEHHGAAEIHSHKELVTVMHHEGHCFLVATAGIKGDDANRCCSGTLVVEMYSATGAYVLQYVSNATYGGGRMTSFRAA